MLAQILFFLFATAAVASALFMVGSRSPINGALWLVLNFFCLACLYLTLNAQFIAVIQILVYAGAIMVLFLFVIMLLNLDALPRFPDVDWSRVFGVGLGLVVLALLLYVVATALGLAPTGFNPEAAAELGSARAIGRELFSGYAVLIQAVAVLLLAATIGAVLIAKRRAA